MSRCAVELLTQSLELDAHRIARALRLLRCSGPADPAGPSVLSAYFYFRLPTDRMTACSIVAGMSRSRQPEPVDQGDSELATTDANPLESPRAQVGLTVPAPSPSGSRLRLKGARARSPRWRRPDSQRRNECLDEPSGKALELRSPEADFGDGRLGTGGANAGLILTVRACSDTRPHTLPNVGCACPVFYSRPRVRGERGRRVGSPLHFSRRVVHSAFKKVA